MTVFFCIFPFSVRKIDSLAEEILIGVTTKSELIVSRQHLFWGPVYDQESARQTRSHGEQVQSKRGK